MRMISRMKSTKSCSSARWHLYPKSCISKISYSIFLFSKAFQVSSEGIGTLTANDDSPAISIIFIRTSFNSALTTSGSCPLRLNGMVVFGRI